MYYNLKTRYITEYNDQPIDKEILIKLLQFNAVVRFQYLDILKVTILNNV